MDLTEKTVLRGGPAELIALAWFRIGCRPRQSLVAVGLSGPRQRTGLIARVDLPPVRHRRVVVRELARMLRRAADDNAVLLVVTNETHRSRGPQSSPRLPQAGLIPVLKREFAREGVDLLDVLAVGAARYRSYECSDIHCCPIEGLPFDVKKTAIAAEMILAGYVLEDDEEALIADVEPADVVSADVVSAAGEAAQSEFAAPADVGWPGSGRHDRAQREHRLAQWRELLADDDVARPIDDGHLEWLIDALRDRVLRDAILLSLLPESAGAPEKFVADPAAHATSPCWDLLIKAQPDPDRLERGVRLLAAVARIAPPGARADALAILAWAAWWSARGVRARLLVARALADQPGHGLAGLVDELLAMGVAPPWLSRDNRGT